MITLALWVAFWLVVAVIAVVELALIVGICHACWADFHHGPVLADIDEPIPYVPAEPNRELEASMRRHPAGNARVVFDALEVERLRAIAAADAAQVTR